MDLWFRLASHLHMPLRDCMERHTHRELLAWNEWLDEQWNQPTRSDHYLMQIAQEVRRSFAKKCPKFSAFKIPFQTPKPAKPVSPETIAQRAAIAKAIWSQRLGRKVETDGEGNGT